MKWLFFIVLLLPPVLMFATCVELKGFVLSEDYEVAGGALMFGAGVLGLLWVVWLVGVPVLGILALVTRGKLLVMEQLSPPT